MYDLRHDCLALGNQLGCSPLGMTTTPIPSLLSCRKLFVQAWGLSPIQFSICVLLTLLWEFSFWCCKETQSYRKLMDPLALTIFLPLYLHSRFTFVKNVCICLDMFVCLSLEQGLAMEASLAWNWKFCSFSLPSAGIMGVCHHFCLEIFLARSWVINK